MQLHTFRIMIPYRERNHYLMHDEEIQNQNGKCQSLTDLVQIITFTPKPERKTIRSKRKATNKYDPPPVVWTSD